MARSLPWEYFASRFILKTTANYGKGHTPSQEAPDWKKQSRKPIIKPDHPEYKLFCTVVDLFQVYLHGLLCSPE